MNTPDPSRPNETDPNAEPGRKDAAEGEASDIDAAEAARAEAADSADARIASLEAELREARDQQLRALAEAENTRRRAQRDREEALKYGAVSLARDLLNVADNLRRALDAAPDEVDPSIKPLVEGIAMVEKELASVLEKHHVRPVPGVGEPFDHNVHQAVVELPSADVPVGHVAQVLQSGYVLHDRLLRASMVAVAKAPDEASDG